MMNSQLSPNKIGGAGDCSAFPFHAGRSSRPFHAPHRSCRRRSLYRSLVHRSSMHAHRLVVAVVGMAATHQIHDGSQLRAGRIFSSSTDGEVDSPAQELITFGTVPFGREEIS